MTITDEGTRIDILLLDSKHRRNITLKEGYLMLYPNHMEYKIVAEYETDERHDYDVIWTTCKTNYRWTRRRSDLSQIDMYFDNPVGQWMVSIEFSGIGEPTGWLHNSPKEALTLYTKLQEYLIGRDRQVNIATDHLPQSTSVGYLIPVYPPFTDK